jgi:hypothetical protein
MPTKDIRQAQLKYFIKCQRLHPSLVPIEWAGALVVEAFQLLDQADWIWWDSKRGFPSNLYGPIEVPHHDAKTKIVYRYVVQDLLQHWQEFKRLHARICALTSNASLCTPLREQLLFLLEQDSCLGTVLSSFIERCRKCEETYNRYWWGCFITVYRCEAEKIFKTFQQSLPIS